MQPSPRSAPPSADQHACHTNRTRSREGGAHENDDGGRKKTTESRVYEAAGGGEGAREHLVDRNISYLRPNLP